MKEYAIGEIVIQPKLEVVEHTDCEGCYFDYDNFYCTNMNCCEDTRKDGKNIIYKEIKND